MSRRQVDPLRALTGVARAELGRLARTMAELVGLLVGGGGEPGATVVCLVVSGAALFCWSCPGSAER